MATKRYERDFKQLEACRRRSIGMLASGLSQAVGGRRCATSRRSGSGRPIAGRRQKKRPTGRMHLRLRRRVGTEGAARAGQAQIVEFLRVLQRSIRGKLLIIRDGLPAHRSRSAYDNVKSLAGQIQLERLPAHAAQLNPAEYVFGYAKQCVLANLCVATIDEVRRYAARRFKSMQRRPKLITAFWQQAELPI